MTKLVYILAASHSGSTLLSLLLGSHPHIATIGEINLSSKAMGDLDRYRCSCGRFIKECDFWQKVHQGMMRRGFVFDLAQAGTDYRVVDSLYAQRLLGPMFRGKHWERFRDVALGFSPTWRKQLPRIHQRNAALASTIMEMSGAMVVVDSSKIGLRLKYLLRNPELDVKVIRLIRDGRAVALTYMNPVRFADAKDPSRRAGGMGGNREKERLSMPQAAYEWRRCVEEGECILRCLSPLQWIEVRYEELCRDTEDTLARLFKFLELDPNMRTRDIRAAGNHIVGNGMRLDSTSQVSLDERWRSALSESELQRFDREAGKINRRYGYA
jgi:hypothetical protein